MIPPRPTHTVTVVIPVFNRAGIVRRLLDALEKQTTRDFEVILIDNNSTDGTADVLNEWKYKGHGILTEVLEEKRPGAAAARQCGLHHIFTEWVMFFDSDDYMAPGHIERALRAVAEHPEADIIGWDIGYNSGKLRTVKPFSADPYRILFDGTMSTQRYMARRRVFADAGGWNPKLKIWNDLELATRIIRDLLFLSVYKIEGEPTVEVFVRPDSITNVNATMENIEEAVGCIARNLGTAWLDRIDLKRRIFVAGLPDCERIKYERTLKVSRFPLLHRLAYAYTRLGGRGAARLLRPFM